MLSPASLAPPRPSSVWLLAAAALAPTAGGSGGSTTVTRQSRVRSPPRAAARQGATRTTTTTTSTSDGGTTTSDGRTLPGTGRPAVTIGDKNYPEQFVLGQLYLKALKAQGFGQHHREHRPPRRHCWLKTAARDVPGYLNVFDCTSPTRPPP